MDRRRGTGKGHAPPNTKEAGPTPTSCYPLAPPSYFYAGGHEQRKNFRGARISERPWRQTRQLGSLVEVYLRADGNERLDAPRPAEDLCDAGRGTQCCTAHHQ